MTSSGRANEAAETPQATTGSTRPPEALTLDQAIELTKKNSPQLHAAIALTDRAESGTRTARAYSNPSVEVFEGKQSARNVPIPGVPGLLQHYAAYQSLEIPAERRARVEVARLARTSSVFGQSNILLSTIAETKHAFYEVLRRKEEVTHATENMGLVDDLRRRVEVQVSVGETGRLELTRAQAEMARALFLVRSARIELANSIALLRVAITAPPEANLDPRGSLERPMRLLPLAELRANVVRAHPAIAQSETDVRQAEASLEHERTLRLPQPVFFGEFERQPDLTFWRLGVNVPLPLWNRREGPIAEADAGIRHSRAVLSETQLQINSALERAYEQYQLADQQVSSLESGSLHEAESAVSAAQAAYRFGERGIVEVLDSQRVLQNVRGDLLDAQFARQSALIDLEALGAITPGGKS